MVNFIKFIKSRNVQVLMVLHSTSFTKNLTSCIHSRVILLIFFLQSAARIMNNQRCHLWRHWHKWLRATFKKHKTTTANNNAVLTKLLTEELIYRLSQFVDFGIPLLLHCILERHRQKKNKNKNKTFPNYLVIFSVGQLKQHAFNNTKAVLLYSFNP